MTGAGRCFCIDVSRIRRKSNTTPSKLFLKSSTLMICCASHNLALPSKDSSTLAKTTGKTAATQKKHHWPKVISSIQI